MNRIDRLIIKAQPIREPWQRLEQDNPYMEKSCAELLDMMGPDTPGKCNAPLMRTREWEHFIYALIHFSSTGELEKISYSALDRLPAPVIKVDQPVKEVSSKSMEAYERLYGNGDG